MVDFVIIQTKFHDRGDYSDVVHTVPNTNWQRLPDEEFETLLKKIHLYNSTKSQGNYLHAIIKPDQTDIMAQLDRLWEEWNETERKKKEKEETRKAAREQADKKKKAEKLRKQLEQLEKDIT